MKMVTFGGQVSQCRRAQLKLGFTAALCHCQRAATKLTGARTNCCTSPEEGRLCGEEEAQVLNDSDVQGKQKGTHPFTAQDIRQ